MALRVMLAILLALPAWAEEGDACDSFDLLRTADELIFEQAQPDSCPPCDCPGGGPTPPPTPSVSITDDPHIRNLAQESFSVNQPGAYTLLRVPQDRSHEALLEVRGDIRPSGTSACKMYTMKASIEGKWLGNKVVHVRPLRRTVEGSNAGGQEVWPLSMMVSEKGAWDLEMLVKKSDAWKSFQDVFKAGENADLLGLPDMVQIRAFHDQAFAGLREGETLQFLVGSGSPDHRAKINVAQASHQALNINLQQAKLLGTGALGGLLGTERHDAGVEKLTEQCRKERASGGRAILHEQGSFPSLASEQAEDDASWALDSDAGDDVRLSTLYSWWY